MKRVFVLLMALALVWALVACGTDSVDPTTDPVQSTTAPSKPSEPVAPTEPVPEPTDPQPTIPPETEPTQPTMPSVGQDPGGFGPIF